MADRQRKVMRAIPLHQYIVVVIHKINSPCFIIRHDEPRFNIIRKRWQRFTIITSDPKLTPLL
ncbi:Uncharacterised protein [Vibrio cholerae]|uniref:Uncharacterized protein n=2 Tax=Vibrio cholerae TaxID=666 RepID=A0A655NUY3_VIBCL|nr:Uncharacterised protein [Vibrio cholerae]CRZ97280.1 Uncharacterised protein [Vibrio cholerae]CSA17911.1 Uncharacterised protein [Vibrio cholerae]